MDLTLARIDVSLPADLSVTVGGTHIVTCRYIGKRQQRKMDLAEYAQKSENRAALGEDWLARMADVEKSNPERVKEHEAKAAQKKKDDPVGWALDQWPDDLVCKHAIKALDGRTGDAGRG